MSRKPTTVRIEPLAQAALENLSRVLKRPMNQLVNEAVKDYVDRRSREVEYDLEATLTTSGLIASAIRISRRLSLLSWMRRRDWARKIQPKGKW
jgi:hypothetical protein